MDNYPHLPDCFIILGTTTYLNVTVLSSLEHIPTSIWLFHHHGDHYLPQPDTSIILGITTSSARQFHHPVYHYLTVTSSCGPQPNTAWLFHHPGDHCLPQLDSSIILWTTNRQYLTVSSSWGLLPTSNWQFHHPGYHYPPQPDSSITLWKNTHLYLTVS